MHKIYKSFLFFLTQNFLRENMELNTDLKALVLFSKVDLYVELSLK